MTEAPGRRRRPPATTQEKRYRRRLSWQRPLQPARGRLAQLSSTGKNGIHTWSSLMGRNAHDTRPADPRPPPARGDRATRQAPVAIGRWCHVHVLCAFVIPAPNKDSDPRGDSHFSRTPRTHGHPFLPFWVYQQSCRCGHIDFVLPGSTELWRPAEGERILSAADGVGARSDIEDVLVHILKVQCPDLGTPHRGGSECRDDALSHPAPGAQFCDGRSDATDEGKAVPHRTGEHEGKGRFCSILASGTVCRMSSSPTWWTKSWAPILWHCSPRPIGGVGNHPRFRQPGIAGRPGQSSLS